MVSLELLKCICRLAQFVGDERSVMMLSWFKGNNNNNNNNNKELTVQDYSAFHLRWSVRVLRSSSRQHVISMRNKQDNDSLLLSAINNSNTFVGRFVKFYYYYYYYYYLFIFHFSVAVVSRSCIIPL